MTSILLSPDAKAKTQYLPPKYEIIDTLGCGTYGKVYKVRRMSDSAVLVLKQVSLEGLSEKDMEETLNEAQVMRHLQHKHVIKYYESFIENTTLNIVMEYANCGDLAMKVSAHIQYRCRSPLTCTIFTT